MSSWVSVRVSRFGVRGSACVSRWKQEGFGVRGSARVSGESKRGVSETECTC